MKGDAYVLVTGLMIAALANLPEIHSQGDAYTLYILQFTDSDSCNKALTNLQQWNYFYNSRCLLIQYEAQFLNSYLNQKLPWA